MTPLLNPPQRRFLRSLFLFLVTVLNIPLHAAVRETWVQHFDGGFPNKTSQPVAMQLDSQGNIYIVGSTANASNLTDYVTLKYAPNGTLLWSKRYGTTNSLNNTPRAMGMDTNENLYVTGTSVTVKYSTAGEELWNLPYPGRGMAVAGTNIYVTGFSETDFVTASIAGTGVVLWTVSHSGMYPGFNISQSLFIVNNGDVVVVGCESIFHDRTGNYTQPAFVRYDHAGNELMATKPVPGYQKLLRGDSCIRGVVQGGAERFYVLAESLSGGEIPSVPFQCFARNGDGGKLWDVFGCMSGCTSDGGYLTSAADVRGLAFLTGSFLSDSLGQRMIPGALYFGLVQILSNGTPGWRGDLPGRFDSRTTTSALPGLAQAIAIDSHDQPTVTGRVYVAEGESSANIATAKYSTNGMLLWAQQYNGAANGHDEGKAIVTDSSGNIYVAGLSTTPEGGTEIVLIKYSESATVEQGPTGTILLQFPGTPGQPYKIQASTNLPNWLDIGLGTATTNGLLQFEDTNATKYPFRFYQTVTPTP